MNFTLRTINRDSSEELDLVTKRVMETVLETIPEFERDSNKALEAFPNFTHEQMREMLKSVFNNPDHELLVAENKETSDVIGHSIFSLKTDKDGKRFGFCFSRYVVPKFRKRGVASELIKYQEYWWLKGGATYAFAQTHQQNIKLQALFEKHGFEKEGPIEGKFFSYFNLRKNYNDQDSKK